MRILCALDIHEGQAIERVAAVGRWATRLEATVDLLFIGPDVGQAMYYGVGNEEALQKQVEKLWDHERRLLEDLLESLPEPLRGDTHHVVSGRPQEAIVQAAEGFDLLVLYTHGRAGLERFFMGSVAERVVRLATVPTLVLRGRA